MPSAINIWTTDGIHLDTYPNETLEVNMGGISLLSLSDRTATYTNTFKLPRTPINEKVFGFSSSLSNITRPSIDAVLYAGLLSKKVTITANTFSKDYQCSLSYDNEKTISSLANLNFFTLGINANHQVFGFTPTDAQIISSITNPGVGNFFYPLTIESSGLHIPENENRYGGGAMMIIKLLSLITASTGITFSGTSYFDESFIYNRNVYFFWSEGSLTIRETSDTNTYNLSCAEIIKILCQMFFLDMSIDGTLITFTPISTKIESTPISVEHFTFSKIFKSNYAFSNLIKYTADQSLDPMIGGDSFIGEGTGIKDAVNVNNNVPPSVVSGRFAPSLVSDGAKPIILNLGTQISAGVQFDGMSEFVLAYPAILHSMSGLYDDILTPMFTNPIICEASTIIDPFSANIIMENRVISSRQLSGRYWVDTMAYNLTTGSTKMKLIKL